MTALITRVEHSLAVAASDTVKVAKFVETSVLPVFKKAQVDQSAIEAVTGLGQPPGCQHRASRILQSSVWSSTPSTLPARRLARTA